MTLQIKLNNIFATVKKTFAFTSLRYQVMVVGKHGGHILMNYTLVKSCRSSFLSRDKLGGLPLPSQQQLEQEFVICSGYRR